MKTCMFTGHRPQNLPFKFNEDDKRCEELKRHLTALIIEKIDCGVTRFLSGVALGTDCYAAEIVLALREKFPYLKLEAIVPCANQSSKWNEKQILRYRKILRQCDKIIVLQETYTYDCMQKRNEYMVDHSDCVIAVWDGTGSGTGNTVKYAVGSNLPVTVLNPIDFTIDKI